MVWPLESEPGFPIPVCVYEFIKIESLERLEDLQLIQSDPEIFPMYVYYKQANLIPGTNSSFSKKRQPLPTSSLPSFPRFVSARAQARRRMDHHQPTDKKQDESHHSGMICICICS